MRRAAAGAIEAPLGRAAAVRFAGLSLGAACASGGSIWQAAIRGIDGGLRLAGPVSQPCGPGRGLR